MLLGIDESARRHGFTDEEIRYAVFHKIGFARTQGRDGQLAFMFVGHPHQGALENNYLEVGVAQWKDGSLHAFHAMQVTDNWRYLIRARR
jgi:hypothetical protein